MSESGNGGETPDGGTFVDEARRYELGSRIATGGMGEVWRGTDTVLNRAVAVKLLKAEYADDPTFRSRFETEARHAASLHHPGVAAVYDFGEAGATDGSQVHRPYLVMELVDGQPLSALLLGQPLDPDVTRDLMAQAADAIGAAHTAGIIHRDVKPANLLVTPDGTVKITDFGIARAAEGMALTETGQVMGTPQYLSPEQAQGTTATPASDVYSLGVVAFECLAGRRPFIAETAVATALAHLREPVPDLPPEIPQDLAAVVQRALSKSPTDRFPDGTAFAAALRDPSSVPPLAAPVPAPAPATDATQVLAGAAPAAAAAGLTTSTPAEPPTAPPEPPPAGHSAGRRLPWAWILLAVLVVAAIIVVAVLASGGDDDDDPTTPEPTRKSTPQDPSGPASTPTEEAPEEPTQPTTQPTEQPTEEPTTEEPSESPSPTEVPTETTPTEEESPTPTETESPTTEVSPSVAQSTQPSKSPVSSPSQVLEGDE